MPLVGRFGSLAGLGSLILPGGAMESIATITVGSGGASSIEFTSVPGGFQHLQIRGLLRSSENTGVTGAPGLQVNGVTTGYASHFLLGDGSAASASAFTSQSHMFGYRVPGATATASAFAGLVLDILDYADTAKNKTIRCFTGTDLNGSGSVVLNSGLYASTSAITSVRLDPRASANFAQHTTVALFGLRAP